jgi:hypothetical protein
VAISWIESVAVIKQRPLRNLRLISSCLCGEYQRNPRQNPRIFINFSLKSLLFCAFFAFFHVFLLKISENLW